MVGFCPLCELTKKLVVSHAIPNAMFKKIFKSNSGQAICISKERGVPVALSQDSWGSKILCADCESELNVRYDKAAVKWLRVERKMLDGVVKFSGVNSDKLILFFVSVLWRAALSGSRSYAMVPIDFCMNEKIRKLIKIGRVAHGDVTVALYRLKDKTRNGFCDESVEQIIVQPWHKVLKDRIVYYFVFEGYYAQIMIPGASYSERKKLKGVIPTGKDKFVIPYISPLVIPEVFGTLMAGYVKNLEGKVHSSVAKIGAG